MNITARAVLNLCTLAGSLIGGAAAAAGTSPQTILANARSLKCYFTAGAFTKFENGHRTVEQNADKGDVTYDNIDLKKGTARMIGNIGAADVLVRHVQGQIWIIETAPAGMIFVSTVFPFYVEGTQRFAIIESRHSGFSNVALGEQSSGECEVLQ